jgi:NAD(P)H-dependent FMN reductase
MVGSDGFAFLAMTGSLLELPKPYPKRHFRSSHVCRPSFFKPSAVVCYSAGPFGGVRAAMQLRAMLAEMGMSSIPSLLPFPKAHDLLDEAGRPTGDRPGAGAARFFAELEWYAEALRAARHQGTPY